MTESEHASARQDCLAIMMAYCVIQDRQDSQGFANLFHPEGAWFLSTGDTCRGIESIEGKMSEINRTRRETGYKTRHLLTSAHVEVLSSDEAKCESYSLVYRTEGEGAATRERPFPSALMLYTSAFRRLEDGGWRIVSHRGVNLLA